MANENTFVKDAGAWKRATGIQIKDAGVWKQVKGIWTHDGGVWRKVYFRSFRFAYTYNTDTASPSMAALATSLGWNGVDPVVGEVVAKAFEGGEAGIGGRDPAVAVEQEIGGDGADGGRAAEGGDDRGPGVADGELGAEGGDFGGDGIRRAVVDDGADHGEAARGVVLLQAVPVGDGAAAGGIVRAEEHDELDLAGELGGADGAGEFGDEVLHLEVVDGRHDQRFLRGGLAAAGGEEN